MKVMVLVGHLEEAAAVRGVELACLEVRTDRIKETGAAKQMILGIGGVHYARAVGWPAE